MSRTLNKCCPSSEGVFAKLLRFCTYLSLWIFGLTPFTKYYFIYHLYILVWFVVVVLISYTAIIFDIVGKEENLNDLISTIQFLAHISGHLVILIDSWQMRPYRQPLYDKFSEIQRTMTQKLHAPLFIRNMDLRLSVLIILFICFITMGHGLIIWTTFHSKTAATMLYWRSLPSNLAIQFKTLEFLMVIVPVNHFIDEMLKNVNDMGERNLRNVFKGPGQQGTKKRTFLEVLPVNQEQQDENNLEIIKSLYMEIYTLFQIFNQAFGLSLLAATAVYFVDFVFNAYFILLLIITNRNDPYGMSQSACFALLAFVLLSLLCWVCEESNLKSRYIGCLVSKLVKPLGNKRYNDLVAEFSVQILHQRFVVTAKEFFSLNLGLLGSMVAAIVTYLVILIQFMFTEKSRKELEMKTTMPNPFSILMENASAILKGNATTSLLPLIVANFTNSSNAVTAMAIPEQRISTIYSINANVATP